MPATGNLGVLGLDVDNMMSESYQVDKVYSGTTLVWQASGEVDTISIEDDGNFKYAAGTYSATQRSTTGSGTGATFSVTLTELGDFAYISAASVTDGGSGYVKDEEITLDLTSIDDAKELTYGVMKVTSITVL